MKKYSVMWTQSWKNSYTGKSLLEALIFASADPQYDKRLFIDLLVKYMKTASSEYVEYTFFFFVFTFNAEYYRNISTFKFNVDSMDFPLLGSYIRQNVWYLLANYSFWAHPKVFGWASFFYDW